jgi:predicted permease
MFDFLRRRRDRDLDDEVRAHLAQAAADRLAAGEAPEHARASAAREFGNVALVKEVTREMWGGGSIERFARDVRYGVRLLRRSPGFTTVAVLSLALGIGANTAIFSVVDALLLRPLPVHDPGRLVMLTPTDDGGMPFMQIPYPEFAQYRDDQALVAIAGVCDVDRSNVLTPGATEPSHAHVSLVSGAYFKTIGADVQRGRSLTVDDDREPGAHPVAVISDAYWTRQLARRESAVGETLEISGQPFTIVGIAAPAFIGYWITAPVDVWVPMAMQSQVVTERPNLLASPTAPWVWPIGRLAAGVTPPQAVAALDTIFLRNRQPMLDSRLTAKERDDARRVHIKLAPLATGYAPERFSYARPLTIVAIVVGLVLLIACSNLANLLLARSAVRQREMAVRAALGASAGRLARQLLTESALLSVIGAAIGVWIAGWGTGVLARVAASGEPPMVVDPRVDLRTLAFAALAAALTAVFFGAAPARRAMTAALMTRLTSRRPLEGRGRRFGMSRALLIAQIALSAVLLVAAGLFVSTLRNLRGQDLGFARSQVLMIWSPAAEVGLSHAPLADLYRRLQERVSAVPGVIDASPSSGGLLSSDDGRSPIAVIGHVRTDDEDFFVPWNLVAPRFFQTVGLPLVAGRDFTAADTTGSARVAIISASMARMYFGTEQAVGRRFGMRRDTGNEIEIVGVVRDSANETPRDKQHRMIYLPYGQDLSHLDDVYLAVRVARDDAAMRQRLREAVRGVDARLPVRSIASIDERLDDALVSERLLAVVSGAFGVLAIVLTIIGLYGVLAYTTSLRTNEIGVRLALGASRRQVLGQVIGEAVALAAAGALIGVPAALLGARSIASQLFGIGPADPVTAAITVAALLAIAVTAAAVPAVRASRVDPAVALRAE